MATSAASLWGVVVLALSVSSAAFSPSPCLFALRPATSSVCTRSVLSGNLYMTQEQPLAVSRRIAVMALVLPLLLRNEGPCVAENTVESPAASDVIAQGSITIKSGVQPTQGGAVYVTARLAGKIKGFATGRELSPIASIKIPMKPTAPEDGQSDLPLTFRLTLENLTPEGAEGGRWWAGQDLTLSARWDEDGNASTRGPNDLVGRTTLKKGQDSAVIELTGRGIAGKIATQKNK